jgi:mono/diheme cytochrome c family protein
MNAHDLNFRLRGLLCIVLACAWTAAMPAEDLSTSSGAQLYRQYCASCHGKGGEGDGAVAPFFGLKPLDLTLINRRSGGTFPTERVRRIVDGREVPAPHGTREMPVWGMQFGMTEGKPADAEAAARAAIDRLVEYLRSIQKPQPQR